MLSDIPRGFTLTCDRCGAKFNTYYYDGGVIAHMNKTDEHNLNASLIRNDFEKTIKKYNDKDRKCALLWKKEN